MRTKIVYEDKDLLIVHKPAGLATQSGQIGRMDVVSELKNYLAAKKEGSYLGVIHRLDQPVEGLLVFAKNKQAAAHLTNQLAKDSLNKEYYAVVCGTPLKDADTLVDFMRKTKENVAEIVNGKEKDYPDAKKAELRYEVMKDREVCAGATLIRVKLQTGRFHQIRCQMAHAGYPLLGDQKYGTDESLALSKTNGIDNVALCAYKISVIHPVSKKKLEFDITPSVKAFI